VKHARGRKTAHSVTSAKYDVLLNLVYSRPCHLEFEFDVIMIRQSKKTISVDVSVFIYGDTQTVTLGLIYNSYSTVNSYC